MCSPLNQHVRELSSRSIGDRSASSRLSSLDNSSPLPKFLKRRRAAVPFQGRDQLLIKANGATPSFPKLLPLNSQKFYSLLERGKLVSFVIVLPVASKSTVK